MATVYILHSDKLHRFYIGFTEDLDTRLAFHTNPEARKFTAKASDWELLLEIQCDSKQQGLRIEQHIKKMKSSIYSEFEEVPGNDRKTETSISINRLLIRAPIAIGTHSHCATGSLFLSV